MRRIDLREYEPSCPHGLSVLERDALREVLPLADNRTGAGQKRRLPADFRVNRGRA